MTTYIVRVTREGEAWLAEVDGLPAAHTYAKNLTALDGAVREVIALVEDLPQGAEPGLDLAWDYSGVGSAAVNAAPLVARRRGLDAARRDLEADTRVAVMTLRGQSDPVLSVRDVAQLVGVTPSWVNQLEKTGHRVRT